MCDVACLSLKIHIANKQWFERIEVLCSVCILFTAVRQKTMHCFIFWPMIFSHNLQESSIHFRPTVPSYHIPYHSFLSACIKYLHPIFNMKGWFLAWGLPWSESLSEQLSNYGVECVEDLKLFLKKVCRSFCREEIHRKRESTPCIW